MSFDFFRLLFGRAARALRDVFIKAFTDSCLFCLCLAACTSTALKRNQEISVGKQGLGPERTFVGIYQVSFERSAFTASGTTGEMWTDFASGGWDQISRLAPEVFRSPSKDVTAYPSATFKISFRGRKSLQEGRFGHMGVYRSKVLVTRIVSLVRLDETD